MKTILLKIGIILAIVLSGLIGIEASGYFHHKDLNNFIEIAWEFFYKFTEDRNVDLLLVGNSHLYTGINPKTLTAVTGANSFIVAAPGTNIIDSYFNLKECLKRTNPQLVVVETYGMNDAIAHENTGSRLSEQFKSFSARKDFFSKLASTPHLFKIGDYPSAWFETIRNHNFIFDRPKEFSQKDITNADFKDPRKKKVFLGRKVRFQKGLSEKTLDKYKKEGAPVDGAAFDLSAESAKYIRKIVELCEEKKIKVMFLTIPMYVQHVDNYEAWRTQLAHEIDPLQVPWLDFQHQYNKKDFNSTCFEDTYNENQHLTYKGSLKATYKLADFIQQQYPNLLKNHKNEPEWVDLFYNEEGFLENNPWDPTDKVNKQILKNTKLNNDTLTEVLLVKTRDKEKYSLIAKVKHTPGEGDRVKGYIIRIIGAVVDAKGDTINPAALTLNYNMWHSRSGRAIFSGRTPPLDIIGVRSVAMGPQSEIDKQSPVKSRPGTSRNKQKSMNRNRKYFYLGLSLLGLILTWYHNLQFMMTDGDPSMLNFIAQTVTTLPATSIAWDITIVCITFFVWYIPEARKLNMKYWWVYIPLSLGVALAFAFPLFMYFREVKLEALSLQPGSTTS